MQTLEQIYPPIMQNGQVATRYPIVAGHGTSSRATVTTGVTLTAAQVSTGYVLSTCTSSAGMTLTLPTGTLLGTYLGAQQGDTFELYVDNTGGSAIITMAVATNGIKSDAANTTAASFGQLTVATGATGLGRFTIMFASSTAYAFTRTA